MKYFVYVSDAKVEMLFAQIPRKITERISAELKVDFKVISLTLRPDSEPSTRYGKVGVVSAYLHEHEPVGTVAMPKRYIEGTMPFRWTVVGSTAVWCGRSQHVMVGLTGAKHHLTGRGAVSGDLGSISFDALKSVAGAMAQLADASATQGPALADHASSLAFIADTLRGPEQSLEFLAINQGVENVDEVGGADARGALQGIDQMLFGSPLYVAMA